MNRLKLIETNAPDCVDVKVRHFHPGNSSRSARKGHAYMTVCSLFDHETHDLLGHGESHCNSNDVPSRSRGREVAVGRAMREAGMRLTA